MIAPAPAANQVKKKVFVKIGRPGEFESESESESARARYEGSSSTVPSPSEGCNGGDDPVRLKKSGTDE